MKKAIFASVALLAMAAAAPASAGVLFSDNFDGEGTPAASTLQYNSFANWTVTGGVDLVYTPNGFGISCSGKCVDLDGTTGPGTLTSSSIAFAANQLLTISFDLSGSQRSSASDVFNFAANFGALTDILGFQANASFIGAGSGDYFGLSGLGFYSESVAGTTGFKTYSLSFTPTTTGSLTLQLGTTSADNVGPLLDNVLVTQAAVPEPATWAMMIGGFALAGAAMRRRKTVLSFA